MFTYPRLVFCKSTGDATREKCNKTNLCSQRCARLCSGAFCLLAAHPLSFHLSAFLPRVGSFALHIHLSPRIFCLHAPLDVITFLLQIWKKTKKILFLVVCLITDVKFSRAVQNCAQQDVHVGFSGPCKCMKSTVFQSVKQV